MSERQIHVEITAIRGYLPSGRDCFERATIGVDFDIDHVDHGAHIWGYNQSQAGLFRTLTSVLRMNAEYEAEVVVKVRASWEDLRKVFTGYVAGRRANTWPCGNPGHCQEHGLEEFNGCLGCASAAAVRRHLFCGGAAERTYLTDRQTEHEIGGASRETRHYA